jgi:micrococcal nuclease
VPRLPARGPYGAALTLLVALLVIIRWWQTDKQPAAPEALAEGAYAVQKAVDGDTLVLANGARVRLIGADTPETVKPNHPVEPYGPEASEFTRRFLARGGWSVRLQFDRERVDKYGRFLAYVYVDDQMLNEALIREGLARAEPQYRYSAAMKARFVAAEATAKAAKRGIWSR